MELLLRRDDATDGRTIGQLLVDGEFFGYTLEDPIRVGPKIYGETAIAPGRYRVIINKSQRFNKMLPLICGVPEFSGVRLHAGNVASDTSGCVLVGLSRSHDSIESSRLAMAALQARLAGALARGHDVFITIENPPAPGQGTLNA